MQVEHEDYSGAVSIAAKHGSVCVTKHNNRWFAVVDGESRIPKVKKGAA